jgi:magnesium chelatase family protein
LFRLCPLDDDCTRVLTKAANRYRLSARSVHRALRVARTIADLEGRECINRDDLLESVTYRLVARGEAP